MIGRTSWLTCSLLMLFISSGAFAANLTCRIIGNNQDFVVEFDVRGSTNYQEVVFSGGNESDTLWYTQQEKSGPSYVFNEQRLVVGENYKIRIEVERGQGSSSRAHYYWIVNGNKEYQESKDADLKSGTINGVGVGLESLSCTPGDVTPPPTYSEDAQYEFGVARCTGSGACTIPLQKSYSYTPLVFVMPTIDSSDPDGDGPATVNVTSVSKTSVTIEQLDALPNRASQAMTEISYFVMEPGIQTIGGHQFVAGYIDTQARASKSGPDSSERIDFSEFGFERFSQDPVVLHQIQTNNNNNWKTSGILQPNRSSVRMFVELSASSTNISQPERIAFLAAMTTSGVLSDDGFNFQIGRETAKQQGSLLSACNDLHSTSLTKIEGLIINKQERRGGHGGWLRRCQINGNQFSFVVDEDFSDRTHLPEKSGYFAFANNLPDVCEVAPYAVQSWVNASNSSITFGGGASVIGTKDLLGEVGFGRVNKAFQTQTACDGKECIANSQLLVPTPDVITIDTGNTTANLGWNPSVEDVPNTKYRRLTIQTGTYRFPAGEYQIGELTVSAGATIIFPNNTILKVNRLSISGGSKVEVSSPNGSLFIWAENGTQSASVSIATDNPNPIKASMFSRDSLTLSGSARVEGTLTARVLSLQGSASVINRDNECGLPPSNNYEIRLDPTSDIALICENIAINATVYNNDVVDSSFNGRIEFRDSGGLLGAETARSGVATFQLGASSSGTKSGIYARAILDGNQTDSATSGEFKFVPFKFDVDDLSVIAGRTQETSARVLACNDGSSTVDSNYSGIPSVSSNLQIPATGVGVLSYSPEFNSGRSSSVLSFDETGQLLVTLTDSRYNCSGFDDCPLDGGFSELTGQFIVRSRPWTFAICDSSLSGEAALQNGTSDGGNGFVAAGESFSVDVLPIRWSGSPGQENANVPIETSSFCNTNLMTQNFFNAQSPSVTVSLSSEVASPAGGVDGLLPAAAVPNAKSPVSPYQISNLIWSEVGSLKLNADGVIIGGYFGQGINQGYRNVGRFYPKYFQVTGDTIWNYPGSGLSEQTFAYMNQPFEGVEFYVEALNTQGNTVQNYGRFDSSVTASFALYESNSSYVSRFFSPTPSKSWVVDGSRSLGTFSLNNSSPSPSCSSELCWAKAEASEDYQDGPFNTLAGTPSSISITDAGINNVDPISYPSGTGVQPQLLSTQPKLVFGRAVLDSVGGVTSSTINIPLRVEYWDGSNFVVHSDDSSSRLFGINIESSNNDIWVENGATAADVTLAAGGSVTSGQSNSITVAQSAPVRQQTQVWLELQSGTNSAPWLRYRWQDTNRSEVDGEEDPSAVVTFGIFRGNDRVIFRGEPGLTGQ
ncbi:MAG: DUF6701 domain-containing protein [Pseudomonadota bacterium]